MMWRRGSFQSTRHFTRVRVCLRVLTLRDDKHDYYYYYYYNDNNDNDDKLVMTGNKRKSNLVSLGSAMLLTVG